MQLLLSMNAATTSSPTRQSVADEAKAEVVAVACPVPLLLTPVAPPIWSSLLSIDNDPPSLHPSPVVVVIHAIIVQRPTPTISKSWCHSLRQSSIVLLSSIARGEEDPIPSPLLLSICCQGNHCCRCVVSVPLVHAPSHRCHNPLRSIHHHHRHCPCRCASKSSPWDSSCHQILLTSTTTMMELPLGLGGGERPWSYRP